MRAMLQSCLVLLFILVKTVAAVPSILQSSRDDLLAKALKFDSRTPLPLKLTKPRTHDDIDASLDDGYETVFLCVDIHSAVKVSMILRSELKGVQTVYTSKQEQATCFIVHDKLTVIQVF
jgi:hypothetical protein